MIALVIASVLSPLENVMKSILDFFHDTIGLPWALVDRCS